MEKKKRTGYKTLLTSLTIAAILSNVSMQEVYATEDALPNEQAIEQKDEELTSETLAESGESEKVVEGAQGSNENVSSIVTEKDDTIIQNNVETIQSAAFNESLLEIENSENAINLTSGVSQADITAPEIVDVVLDRSSYEAGETVTGHVVLRDESEIEYVFVIFENDGSHDSRSFYDSSYSYETYRNEAGDYIVPFSINLPANMGSTSFRLGAVQARDTAQNEKWFYVNEGELPADVNFEVVNLEVGDLTAPTVVDVVLDRSSYEAGETVTGHVVLRDESEIEYVFVIFENDGSHDSRSFYDSSYSYETYRNEAGDYIVPFSINLPANMGSTSFRLGAVQARDTAQNEKWFYVNEGELPADVSFNVLNSLETKEEIEERFADTTIINHITLILNNSYLQL